MGSSFSKNKTKRNLEKDVKGKTFLAKNKTSITPNFLQKKIKENKLGKRKSLNKSSKKNKLEKSIIKALGEKLALSKQIELMEKHKMEIEKSKKNLEIKLRQATDNKIKKELSFVEIKTKLSMKIEQNDLLKEEISSFQARLDEKNNLIIGLNKKLEKKNQESKRLVCLIEEKEREIAKLLETEIKLKDQIVEMESNNSEIRVKNIQLRQSLCASKEKSEIMNGEMSDLEEDLNGKKKYYQKSKINAGDLLNFVEEFAKLQEKGILVFYPSEWTSNFNIDDLIYIKQTGILWLNPSALSSLKISFSNKKKKIKAEITINPNLSISQKPLFKTDKILKGIKIKSQKLAENVHKVIIYVEKDEKDINSKNLLSLSYSKKLDALFSKSEIELDDLLV